MEQLSLRQIQEVLLGILKELDSFCRSHDIRYSLAGGSLLGALRHKGFIPWDDDADVLMPRPDYERFISLYNKETDSRFHVLTQEHNENKWYVNCYSKMEDCNTISREWGNRYSAKYGINVDIFPVDGLPEDEAIQKKNTKRAGHLTHLISLRQKPFIQLFQSHPGPPLAFLEAHCRPLSYWMKECQELLTRYDFETSPYAGAICGVYRTREIFPRQLFENYSEYPFEDIQLMGIADAETYLASLYGDWHKLPPVSQREGKHRLEAYRLK